ncbi:MULTISPECIES: DUF1294 domain-containing protein [unclassified Romboutsia]|uniref:DUF1294 domain-containing protein n=1 Tax=unclassified Romboutsia TaxID=2626894 RepID=UPI000820B944|nr:MULTISPECIES: DUF1294 domain-containing protein [unclassified Romboutsia]SCH13949.1 Protein of uncharacterised function (DUF1294) [uncultured Clostridium sp.]
MNNLFLYYIFTINIIGFILMYIDKMRAIKNQWRIRESTLFTIAYIGGSVGSLLGMYLFRHKTKHTKFTIGFTFILLIQIALISMFYI